MADHIAKHGVTSKSLEVWPLSPPPWLAGGLNFDVAALEQPPFI